MSMKNKDTWVFAHKYCGKIWCITGLIMLPISVVLMLLVFGKSENTVGTVGAIICFVQLIPLMATIIPTECALKKTFDKDGNRK